MNNIRGRAVTGIDKKALELLMSHNYPGNVRELENIIEHALVLCANGNILPQHLPDGCISQTPTSPDHNNLGSELKSAEARVIIDALKRNNYSRLAAAHDLGLHKSTLFRKIKRLGITLPKIDGRSASH